MDPERTDAAGHSRFAFHPSGNAWRTKLVSTLSAVVLLIPLPWFKPFQAENQQDSTQDRESKPTDEKDELFKWYQIEQRSEQVHFDP